MNDPADFLDTVRFCVPTIGSEIQLARDWKFFLYQEYRNYSFINKVLPEDESKNLTKYSSPKEFTLPAGTKLTVSRIYIRQGKKDYDSITFSIQRGHCPDKKIHGRFWAKLIDVNKIVCFPVGQSVDIFKAYIESNKEDFKDRFDHI